MAIDLKTFWNNNWDKVISIFVSIVIAGLIGYFSGILAIKSDLGTIRERVKAIETEMSISVKPKLNTVSELEKKILECSYDFEKLKTREDIAAETRNLLQQLIEIQRNKTVKELRQLLKEN